MFWLPSNPASQADEVDSVSSDSLGEQLYELINLYNTEYTQKITGYHFTSVYLASISTDIKFKI